MKRLLPIFIFSISYAMAQDCCPPPRPPEPCKPCPPVCFKRGYPNKQNCFPPGYNEPADYELDPCSWDMWIDASFTYWDAEQEGMDIGVSSTELGSVIPLAPINGEFLFQDRSFKPGFKVGAGMDFGHDNWLGYLEYTWFRSTTNTIGIPPGDARGGTALWILSNWYNRQANIGAVSIASTWKLSVDLIDASISRPFYQGTHLIIVPFGGLRYQLIRQKFKAFADIFTSDTANPPLDATSKNQSNSMAIGPRIGTSAKWHIGWGLRLEGDASGSIVFTRYSKVLHKQTPTSTLITASPIGGKFRNYNCLRADTELDIGLGWGRYFDCQNYHFDLLATYDFQIFWNQNIMRQLADTIADGTGHSPSNLYLQGLTVKAQFDF